LLETTWPELLNRLEGLNYRAAVVGLCGSGKTTLLEDIELKLSERFFNPRLIRLNEDQTPRLNLRLLDAVTTLLTSHDLVLIDGAERMDWLAWRWIKWRCRAAGGLIITAHKPGRLPTLWECRTSPLLLAQIAADLIEADPTELYPQAEALFIKHDGNLREALLDWYSLASGSEFSLQRDISVNA